jgi:hypothetical protein
LAPSAIYNFNEYSFGSWSSIYLPKAKITMLPNFYGGSIIGLFNPIPVIQLSAELEELRININLDGTSSNSQDYWNTGLFLGAGYRSGNATIGARYNVERY